MTDAPIRATRRGALAVAGSALLAGCGGIVGPFSEDDPVVLDGAELREIADAGAPDLPKRVPVDIGNEHLTDAATRAESLLESAPEPLGPAEVPNGAMREDLSHVRTHATEALEEAGDAPTDYEELDALHDARREARNLAAAWEAIDADLAREDLLASASTVREGIEETRDRHEYVGDDPVRALLAHRAMEDLLFSGARSADVDREHRDGVPENPVTIGELAGDLEAAAAAGESAAHLYERFTGSLDTRQDLRGGFGSAGDALLDEIERRQAELPTEESVRSTVSGDLDDTPAGWALRQFHDQATRRSDVRRARENGRPASAVFEAQERLARIGAFESLAEAVEGGEDFAVESVADARSIRDDAVDAIETALETDANARLTRAGLEGMGGWIRFTDDELARLGEEIEARHLDGEIASYLAVTHVARSMPAASSTVADALEGS